MAKLKITAIIDIDDEVYNLKNESEMKWFVDVLNDRESTHVILWNNDIGDEIGGGDNFDWEFWEVKNK